MASSDYAFPGSTHMQPGMTKREWLASQAPITPEMAARVYGEGYANIELSCDEERRAFLAVWTFLAFEWADAMIAEHDRA